MKWIRVFSILITTAFASATFAQDGLSPVDNETNQSSQTDARTVKSHTRTPEQYRAFASHLRVEEESFRQRAAVEKRDWERRSKMTASLYAKYPRPADSARNLYEYYSNEAGRKETLAAEYEKLAEASQTSAKQ